MRPPAAASRSSLRVAGAGERVFPPHLRISGGGACEKVISGLAAESCAATLETACPLVLDKCSRMVVHEHITVEVTSYKLLE